MLRGTWTTDGHKIPVPGPMQNSCVGGMLQAGLEAFLQMVWRLSQNYVGKHLYVLEARWKAFKTVVIYNRL